MTLVLLHPGEMGVSLGAVLKREGHLVRWVSAGRSERTRARALDAGLEEKLSLIDALESAELVMSVCPPHAVLDVARGVAALNFRGVFVDANAIAPHTALEVARVVTDGGATYVDGGIVGPPVRVAGDTRLYLSNTRAAEVASLFSGTALEAIALSGDPFAASALKMAYAAWTKGSAALLLAARAYARVSGAEDALEAEWRRSLPELFERVQRAASSGAKKGWRWRGEMLEIASSFEHHDLPNGFHIAAAEVFQRLEVLKDAESPTLEAVLETLVESD
jgi:3-hydroxyisobutyrate dehydrogenase-like beta-hydroxyacid dehydrogenase